MARRLGLVAWLVVVSALAAGGAACGASSPKPPASSTSGRLVTYERSGGIAGRTVRLSVSRARRVSGRPAGHSFTLSETEYNHLVKAIKRADLAGLPARTSPDQRVADGFTYVISTRGQTIHTETGAIPKQLQPLLSRLGTLLRRTGAR